MLNIPEPLYLLLESLYLGYSPLFNRNASLQKILSYNLSLCKIAALKNARLLSINKMLWHFFLHTIFQRFPAAQKPALEILLKHLLYEKHFVRKSFMTCTLACRIIIKIFCEEFSITMLTVCFHKNLFWLFVMLNSFWVLMRTFCSFLFCLFLDKKKQKSRLQNTLETITARSLYSRSV
jgi:hypothetical protein